MRKLILIFCFSFCAFMAGAQTDSAFTEQPITLHQSGDLFGTLFLPKTGKQLDVVLIIAGSGPTDRNGNNPTMKNDALKKLAYQLAAAGIASVRYDKRGIAESKAAAKSEADLRFEDYVQDAKSWIDLLKKDKRFARIMVLGHSEGSLIGMLAAGKADKFISVAGAGQSADKILKEQLSNQPKPIQQASFPIIDTLVMGQQVTTVHPLLFNLFRPSVQPYLISWFKYDPQVELKKLTIPVLIVQGTADIQVGVEDAKRLAAAQPKAQLVIIEGMNHILRTASSDRKENLATYGNPNLPLHEALLKNIIPFIQNK